MKKIIAIAVASAFVAPVMAADVTISGDFEYMMVMPDGGDNSLVGGDQIVTVSASSETSNGLTVSASMNLLTGNDQSVGTDGGESIKIGGAFGTISIGDVSSALDNVGDYTDVAEVDGGFDGDGPDASILYVLPTVFPGLKLSVSHAPDGDNFGGSPAADSYSAAYSFGAGEVYYGASEPANGDETSAMGVKYSVGGLTVALESGETGTEEYQGAAAVYKMGDTKLIVERQDSDTEDDTIYGVTQSLGGGLSVYAQMTQNDMVGASDTTYLGVEYSF